jgi:hypothetical protein
MLETYAVIPEGWLAPTAFFDDLEAAIEWGLRFYGSGGFRIRGCSVAAPSPQRRLTV